MGWLLYRYTYPVAIAVETGGGAAHAGPALAARAEVGVTDAVTFFERAAQRVSLDVRAFSENVPHHLVAKHLRDVRIHAGTLSGPEVDIGATDVGAPYLDEYIVGAYIGKRVLAELHRLLDATEYGYFAFFNHRGIFSSI
jgi:hypothetical protein